MGNVVVVLPVRVVGGYRRGGVGGEWRLSSPCPLRHDNACIPGGYACMYRDTARTLVLVLAGTRFGFRKRVFSRTYTYCGKYEVYSYFLFLVYMLVGIHLMKRVYLCYSYHNMLRFGVPVLSFGSQYF